MVRIFGFFACFSSFILATAALGQTTSLNVFKQGDPNPVIAGDSVTYTITVSTEGPDDAANATLSDPLPAGTTFVSLAEPGGWSCTTPAVGANGTVTCSIAAFTPGSAVFTLVVDTDPSLANGSTLSNTASVTTTTADPDQEDNVSTANATVETHADLGIDKSESPDPAPIGSNVTFTLDYTSAGPSDAANVTISDNIPAGLGFVSITAPGFSCTTPAVGASGLVTCTAAVLNPGANGTITIVASVDAGTTAGTSFTNTATIGSDTVDPNPANAGDSVTFVAQSVSDLAVTKDASPDPVVAGSAITYTIGVTASGPSPAPNVTLTDVLPANTTFTSIASPAGWNCTTPAVGANGTVTCTNASLPSGASDSFTLVVAVDASLANGSSIANTASVSGAVTEDTSNNSDTATVTTSTSTDVGVTKTAPATIFAGNTMTYSIAYNVAGPSTAVSVTITDSLPVETSFASVSAPGFSCTTPAVGANGVVTCTAASLAPGANGTILIDVTIDPAVTPGTVITNTATVTATADSNASNDSSTATTTVSPASVTGVKTVSTPSRVIAGSTITYTIVLHNGGAFAQNDNPGDEFVDVLPPSLALVSATASSGTATATIATNTVTWNGTIASGSDVTITITATVNEGAGASVSNQGTIHFDGNGDGTNESTTVTEAPGGGPTVFAVGAVGIPTLSPLMLVAAAMMLALAGWWVAGR